MSISKLKLFASLCLALAAVRPVEGQCCIGTWIIEDTPLEIEFPLRSVTAASSVIDGIAEVTVSQFFETVTTELIPTGDDFVTRYEIPIDKDAAVHTFIAEYGERVIEGIVKSKDDAREDFDEAVEEGKPAFIGEESGDGIFKIEFGNVPLGVQLKVTLKYAIEVPALGDNKLRFVIPTSLGPNLTPIPGNPVGLDFRNGVFDLTFEAFASSGTVSVSSPTHDVTITETETGSRLVMEDIERTRRDVVILIETVENIQDFAVTVYQEELANDEGSVVMLSLFPDLSGFPTPFVFDTYIFVVDQSGSMVGERIRQAGVALRAALEALQAPALFNIVGFGSEFEPLFETPQVLAVDTIAMGLAVADNLAANLGGTIIRGPLEWIFDQEFDPQEQQRNIFVLTDGDDIINQNRGIIDFITENRGASRIFSIGIGEPDIDFIEQIAEAGGGVSEIVDNSELSLIQEVVRRQIEIATESNFLQDINIDWGASGVVAPFGVSTVFSDRRFLFYYLIDGPLPESISVTASVSGSVPVESVIPRSNFIDTTGLGQATSVVSKMAAKMAIQDLEDARSELNLFGADAQAIKDEIIRIGVKYQIASTETSFIAVDNFDWTSINARDAGGGDSVSEEAPSSGVLFGLCFSGDNSVRRIGGDVIALKDLQIGDIVESGYNTYSEVYGFGHKDNLHSSDYLLIDGQDLKRPLEISSDHMVFVANRGAIPAHSLHLGDMLMLGTGSMTSVNAITRAARIGAYAPFTNSGTIVVNGVISSNYVSIQGSDKFAVAGFEIVSTQWLAHAMQSPRRMLCRFNRGLCEKETYADSGVADWVVGPYVFAKWLVREPGFVLGTLAVPVVGIAALLRGIEVLTTGYGAALLIATLLFVVRRQGSIKKLKTA